ncbi:MAG: MFS transporter [Candidatus Zixiibacteriota bacterium]
MLLNEYDKPTKAHYQILLMSWAGWVFDFYDLILYTFLLTLIGKDLNLSNQDLSYVLGASLAATALGGVVFGVLSDRCGRKTVLQWTILTYSLGTLLCGFATGLWTLIAFRIITGLGVGGEWATGQTYVGETFHPKVRGRYGAYMQTGAPIGIALASVIGGFVAPEIGWRWSFIISVLPAAMVIHIRRSLPESDFWLERRKTAAFSLTNSPTPKSSEQNRLSLLLSKVHRRPFILVLVLATLDMTAYWFTYSWLPGYLQQQRQFSLVKSALWMLVTQTGGFLGYTSFGFVADKLGRRPAYSIYCFIMALGLLMITLMWDAIAANPTVILLFMFLVGFGTGMFGGYGPLISELFPTGIRSTAMGAAFNIARGLQFFTPVTIARIAEKHGLGTGISLAAIFALLTGIWIWTFPETRGKRLDSA